MKDANTKTVDRLNFSSFDQFISDKYWLVVGLGLSGIFSVGLAFLRDQQLIDGIDNLIIDISISIGLLLVVGLAFRAYLTYASDYLGESAVLSSLVTGKGLLLSALLASLVLLIFISALLPLSATQRLTSILMLLLITVPILAFGIAT